MSWLDTDGEKELKEQRRMKHHEKNKQKTKDNLAQLAGGAVGSGAGYMATIPLDARHQNKKVVNAKELMHDKQISKENWRTLLKLQQGDLSLEDLPEGQRDSFAKRLKDNADDLKHFQSNPRQAYDALNDFDKGKVLDFNKNQKAKMRTGMSFPGVAKEQKNIFPFKGTNGINVANHKVRHPTSSFLPGLLGLAGLVGVSQWQKNRDEKEE